MIIIREETKYRPYNNWVGKLFTISFSGPQKYTVFNSQIAKY